MGGGLDFSELLTNSEVFNVFLVAPLRVNHLQCFIKEEEAIQSSERSAFIL